jgi:hypothetical protein
MSIEGVTMVVVGLVTALWGAVKIVASKKTRLIARVPIREVIEESKGEIKEIEKQHDAPFNGDHDELVNSVRSDIDYLRRRREARKRRDEGH